jgi:hypothetical protein
MPGGKCLQVTPIILEKTKNKKKAVEDDDKVLGPWL